MPQKSMELDTEIDGSWQLIRLVIDGQLQDDSVYKTIRFTAGQVLASSEQPHQALRFCTRDRKRVKEIDFLLDHGNGERQVVARGIYRLEDGGLALCFLFDQEPFRLCVVGDSVPPRPRDFDVTSRTEAFGKVVLTFKRQRE